MPNELSREITVRISDCDARGHWRPSAILVETQELAEAHSASLGFPRKGLIESGIVWILYRQRIRLRASASFGDRVRLTTWPGAVEGPLFPRYFLLEDEAGACLGEIATSWILMDIHTRRPMRPSALPGQVEPNEDRQPPMPLPGMLRVADGEAIGERVVRYSDVDVNGHMNNTRYIDWICDALPYETLIRKGLVDWQINYISEAKPGEALALYRVEEEARTLICGKRASDGRTVFEAGVTFGEG